MKVLISQLVLIISLLLCISTIAKAQTNTDQAALSITSSVTASATDSELPFWLWTNQYGKIDPGSATALVGIEYSSGTFEKLNNQVEFHAELIAGKHSGSTVHFQQLYLQAEWLGVHLNAGRFPSIQGRNQDYSGLGSLMISRNATPMPGIKLSLNEFYDVPLTNGLFSYRGSFGNFWFENQRRVEGAQLHSKDFYLQMNILTFSMYAGVFHNVMWAGDTGETGVGKMPSGFDDYLRVITGRGGSVENSIFAESNNALGNTVGGYDFGVLLEYGDYLINLTKQSMIEDAPGVQLRSWTDGIWNLRVERDAQIGLQWFRIEHLNTMRQDSRYNQPLGRANYFNHYIYEYGWSYEGMVLGNPLMTYDRSLNRVVNNMVLAHSGMFGYRFDERIYLETGVVYSRNYGTCNQHVKTEGTTCGSPEQLTKDETFSRDRFRTDRYSWYAESFYNPEQFPAMELQLRLAVDTDKESGVNVGMHVGLKYEINP